MAGMARMNYVGQRLGGNKQEGEMGKRREEAGSFGE